MRHLRDGSRLEVHAEGISPYLLLPPEQTDDVLAELRAAGITGAREHAGIEVDGVVQEEIVNFDRGADPAAIQKVMDSVDCGRARAGVMGLTLDVIVRRRAWRISIRRHDGKPDPDLAKLHGSLVSRAQLREIIPGWQGLAWTDQGAAMPAGPAESRADDPPYRIWLTYRGDVNAADVKAEFLKDLAI